MEGLKWFSVYTTNGAAKLRPKPGTNNKPLYVIPKGKEFVFNDLSVMFEGKTWANGKYKGKEGWVCTDFLKEWKNV